MARREGIDSESKNLDRARRETNQASPCATSSSQRLRFGGEPRCRHVLLIAGLVAVALACGGCAKKVAVPNVVEQDVDQARQALTAAGLKPGNVTGVQGDVPPGSYVVSQMPAAGSQLSTNSPVDLQIEAPSLVPDLTKSSVTDAVNTLQDLGLKVTFIKGSEGLFGGGPKVTAQAPTPNTAVHRGGVVTLTVSSPSKMAQMFAAVAKEAAYSKLKPEYRQSLDQFFGPNQPPATK
jgi:serine/threonine-protein kinase